MGRFTGISADASKEVIDTDIVKTETSTIEKNIPLWKPFFFGTPKRKCVTAISILGAIAAIAVTSALLSIALTGWYFFGIFINSNYLVFTLNLYQSENT